jgi:hypothetical protein
MIKKITPKKNRSMIECSEKGPSPTYPHLRVELEHLPEAKKWDIGKEYTIELQLKMTGISISRFQNDVEFDIVGMSDGKESTNKMGPADPKKELEK